MNCPYCDETVHLMSKFCPKCGLPLKEEATVMGAYASDDTGPSLYVVGGGAAAILAIALLIGWISSRGDGKPVQEVKRQQLGNPAFSVPAANPAFGSLPMNPAFGTAGSRGSSKSADYSPQVRWAHKPSPTPPPARPRVVVPEPEGPEAPPHLIVQHAAVAPKRPARVALARPSEPPIPPAPSVPPPLNLSPGQALPEGASILLPETPDGLPRLTPEGRQLEADGIIAYDPVQERYVLVPGKKRRTNRPPRIRYVAPGPTPPLPVPSAPASGELRPAGAGE